jgi:hypothetical protein
VNRKSDVFVSVFESVFDVDERGFGWNGGFNQSSDHQLLYIVGNKVMKIYP